MNNGWIDVHDAMPGIRQKILVTDGHVISQAVFRADEGMYFSQDYDAHPEPSTKWPFWTANVLYWMPLPGLPEQKNKEKK